MDEKQQQELVKRLAKHPELRTQIAGLLEEVENQGGGLVTADEAEEALIVRVRQIGRAGLTAWAEQRSVQLDAVPPARARRGAKKNSGG